MKRPLLIICNNIRQADNVTKGMSRFNDDNDLNVVKVHLYNTEWPGNNAMLSFGSKVLVVCVRGRGLPKVPPLINFKTVDWLQILLHWALGVIGVSVKDVSLEKKMTWLVTVGDTLVVPTAIMAHLNNYSCVHAMQAEEEVKCVEAASVLEVSIHDAHGLPLTWRVCEDAIRRGVDVRGGVAEKDLEGKGDQAEPEVQLSVSSQSQDPSPPKPRSKVSRANLGYTRKRPRDPSARSGSTSLQADRGSKRIPPPDP